MIPIARGAGRSVSDSNSDSSTGGSAPSGSTTNTGVPEGNAPSGPAPKGSGERRTFAEVPKTWAVWFATAGGLGFGPWAPGTWGALATVFAFGLGLGGVGWPIYLAVVIGVSALGVVASTAAERDFARHDDGRIVIDEVAGQLVSLAPLLPLWGMELGRIDLAFGLAPELGFLRIDTYSLLIVTAFVAFRWFDIRKPGRVRWAERRFEAGMGVMADDIVAGVYGAIPVMVLAYIVLAARGFVGTS